MPKKVKLNPLWVKRMKEPAPIDCLPNLIISSRLTEYLFSMEERKYTIDEMKEQLDKCWNTVLKVNHRNDKKC